MMVVRRSGRFTSETFTKHCSRKVSGTAHHRRTQHRSAHKRALCAPLIRMFWFALSRETIHGKRRWRTNSWKAGPGFPILALAGCELGPPKVVRSNRCGACRCDRFAAGSQGPEFTGSGSSSAARFLFREAPVLGILSLDAGVGPKRKPFATCTFDRNPGKVEGTLCRSGLSGGSISEVEFLACDYRRPVDREREGPGPIAADSRRQADRRAEESDQRRLLKIFARADFTGPPWTVLAARSRS